MRNLVAATWWCGVGFFTCCAASGCGLARSQQASLSPDTPAYTVEMRPLNNKKIVEVTSPLPRSITVQQALEDSKATKKFKRMKVAVARKSEETGKTEYFTVPFDKKKHKIDMLHDYALRPGDRVVVIEDTGTMITDMLDQATEPLNAMGMNLPTGQKKSKRPF